MNVLMHSAHTDTQPAYTERMSGAQNQAKPSQAKPYLHTYVTTSHINGRFKLSKLLYSREAKSVDLKQQA